jgi:hypothetical protein
VFVLFRHKAEPHVTRLTRNGTVLFPASAPPEEFPVLSRTRDGVRIESSGAGQYEAETTDGTRFVATFQNPALQQEVSGTWDVRFAPGWGAPELSRFERLKSWTESGDPGIRYYSGTATYSTDIEVSPAMLLDGRRLKIDLGEVREIAEISLNGQSLGTLWKPPFRLDITAAAKAGRNHLQVSVTNLWPNRLIGDEQPGVVHRFTHTNIRKFTKDSPLLPSGLLGPVRLISAETRTSECRDRPTNR